MNFFNKTLLHAPQFLTEKRSIFQFLTLGAIVAILFWMFYKPIGITGSKNGLWGESMPLYSAILVCAGITIIVLSRVLLYNVIKRVNMKISGYLTWLICEWIIIIAALTFLAQSINSNSTLSLSIIFGRVTIFVSVWLIIPYSFSILLFQIRERNMEISALKEIGNIITGSYLSSLSTLTQLKIISSIPDISIDMAGAILSVPAIEFGTLGDKILLIATEFTDDVKLEGYFILVPDLESYDKILTSLGM